MANRILLRRDTAAAWTSANPTLAAGEAGYETDTGKLKLGDGSTAWNSLVYTLKEIDGWQDLVAPISTAKAAGVSAPDWAVFQPGGSGSLYQYAFAVGDEVFLNFHIPHDIKPNSTCYVHVHWTTDGTSTASTRWQVEYSRALGHDQAAFSTPASIYLEEAASGTAWQHMVTEDATGITLTEPDELLLIRLARVTNGGTNNSDAVFGLALDFHYQSDRLHTPNRAPDFY